MTKIYFMQFAALTFFCYLTFQLIQALNYED